MSATSTMLFRGELIAKTSVLYMAANGPNSLIAEGIAGTMGSASDALHSNPDLRVSGLENRRLRLGPKVRMGQKRAKASGGTRAAYTDYPAFPRAAA